MHSVLDRAKTNQLAAQRHEATVREISRHAQLLADEHGLDGFTMDDLAAAVGVSRRTLFNHVPSKLDAVLGSELPPEPEPFAVFRRGGPTGLLVDDLRTVGAEMLALNEHDAEQAARMRRLLRGDPRLMEATHARLEQAVDLLTEAIHERGDDPTDPFAARVTARLVLGIFVMSIEEFIDDPTTSISDHYLRVFDSARELFA